MPRPERRLDPDADAVQMFACELRELRERAGSLAYRQMATMAHYSPATLASAAGGRKLPSLAVTLAYVRACGGNEQRWEARWREVAHAPADSPDDHSAEVPVPYVGLAAFQPDDADRFFGRDRLVSDLRALVDQRRLVGVFGASGSGKSSLLRAGLVGRSDDPAVVFTPGTDPVEECAVHLAALTGGSAASWRDDLAADPANLHLRIRQAMAHDEGDLLMVIDQFEEVVTLCSAQARRWLVDAVTHAAGADNSRVRVVLGVRADFYGHGGLHPELVDALSGAHVLVGPMTVQELREAITRPAVHAGYQVETALVARLVSDATGQPAVLPLVSHTLRETWRRRHGVSLTLAGYEAAGGIQHAVAHTAEEVYHALEPGQQLAARRLFLRLIAIGEGTEDTKRRIGIDELHDDPDTAAVIERLTEARLIVVDHAGIEMIHEALIRHWPRLGDWLTDNRDGLRIHRHLTDAAASWQALNRDSGSLYRGTRLALTREWANTGVSMLTSREKEFLDASIAAEMQEQRVVQRRHRQLRLLAAGLSVLLLVAVAALGVAVYQRDDAVLKGQIAASRQLASEAGASLVTDVGKAIRLTLQGYDEYPTEEARSRLLSLASSPNHHGEIRTPDAWGVREIAFSPDGNLLATTDASQVRLWDARTGKPESTLPMPDNRKDRPERLVFSPDSKNLFGANSGDGPGSLVVWDVDRQRAVSLQRGASVNDVAISPDGNVLAAAGDDTLYLWDAHRGEVLAAHRGHHGRFLAVTFSLEHRRLASLAEDSITLWDLPTRTTAVTIPIAHQSVSAIALSPDGRVLATAGLDGIITLWDAASGARQASLTRHDGQISAIGFDPQGQTLVSAGANSVVLWDIASRDYLTKLTTDETTGLHSLAISPDGNTIAAASYESVLLWDRRRLPFLGYRDPIDRRTSQIAVRPDGSVTGASLEGSVVAWDSARRPTAAMPRHQPNRMWQNVLSPDGRRTADLSNNQSIIISDTASDQHIAELTPPPGQNPVAVAFSPDAQKLAVAYSPMSIVIWDLPTRRRINEFTVGFFGTLKFSPDGERLVALNGTKAEVWHVPSHRRVLQVDLDTYASSGDNTSHGTVVDLSPDGSLFAKPEADGNLAIWDVASGRPSVSQFGHGGRINTVSFSPNGRLLATASDDKTIVLWDVVTRTRWATLTGHTQSVHKLAWSPDSTALASASNDRTIVLWTVDTDRAVRQLCDSLSRYRPAEPRSKPAPCQAPR